MVTLQSADNALKTLYLGVVAEQLNTQVNPLLAKIKQTTQDVWGKEIRKVAPFGLNGGVGAGTEEGELPKAAGNNYAQFVLTLKNLYGTLEISDKAVRASENSAGAFVNLLNSEMEGLIKASCFNFGRMLFGDGSGKLATILSASGSVLTVDGVKNVMEGQVIDILNPATGRYAGGASLRVEAVDRAASTVKLSGAVPADVVADDFITMQGSLGLELTGLGAVFGGSETLYGLNRADNAWLKPYIKAGQGLLNEMAMQSAIDHVEETAGSQVDFIVCSSGVKRAFQNYLTSYKRNIDIMNLASGYTAMSYNGIPLVSDRFASSGEMYLLNSTDFNLHQLCDWQWLEGEDGKVIKQVNGKPVYTATLVKYADLICNRPSGQAKICNITEK